MDLLIFIPAFLGFLYASYTDLKSKLVPDNLVYSMLGLGILIRILQAIFFGLESVSFTIIAVVIYSLIGYTFYRFRAWADGDFGMFLAVALFLPSTTTSPWPAYFSFMANLALIGVVYGFTYTIYLAFKPKIFSHWKRAMTQPAWFFSFVLGLMGAFATNTLRLTYLPGFILGFFTYPLTIVSQSLKEFMKMRVTPDKLETGDWVLEDIRVGKEIIIPKDNPGLTKSQIARLQDLHKKGKIKTILIKDGIPFIPVFFLAYLANTFYGDLIYSLVQFLMA